MKKYVFSILIILICIIMVGCGNNKNDKFKISLDSNPTTGYKWTHKLSKKGIIKVKSSYDDSKCAEDMVGCGGQQIYEITALKPGSTTLTLTYAFVNADANKETKTAIYKITVDNNLKITEEHSGTYFNGN